jgi:CRP-like cAMP-binding protein
VTRPQRYDDLGHCALFAAVPAARRDELARGAVRIELADGEVLFDEGSEGHEFVLVVQGRVVVAHDGADVAKLGQGEYLGEAALLDHAHRNATARADCDDTVIICIGQAEFKAVVDQFPQIGEEVRRTAEARRVQS